MKKARVWVCAGLGVLLTVGCSAEPGPEENDSIEPEATGVIKQAVSDGNVVICAGGYAPVRYWNACGGTIHNYYPQGWHGWTQNGTACGGGLGGHRYFHPHNGANGGWIEEWRLCNY